MKLWALGLSALLVFAMFSMLPKAALAQTATVGTVQNWLQANYSDGTNCIFAISENLPSATITGQNCNHVTSQITSFNFKVVVVLPSPSTAHITSSSITGNVRALNQDGTYHTVAVTGGPIQPPMVFLNSGLNVYWLIYQSTASAQVVEAAMGSTPQADFPGDIRLTSTQGSVTIDNNIYNAASQTEAYVITQKSGSGGGGCVGNSCPPTGPTGRIYPVVTVFYTDGSKSIKTPGPSINYTASFVILQDPIPKNVSSINWELRAFVDNDAYSLPISYNGFLDPGSTSNFGVTVGANDVLKAGAWNNRITKISGNGAGTSGTYHLLDMTAQGADIDPLLSVFATSGGVKYTQGIISFSVKSATLTFATPTQSFPISVGAFLTQYSLLGQSVTSTCTIDPATGQCKTDQGPLGFLQSLITAVAKALNVSEQAAQIILVILIGGTVVVGLVMVKATKKGKKGINWKAL